LGYEDNDKAMILVNYQKITSRQYYQQN